MPFTVDHGDRTYQQEDQHEGCSQEDYACRRSGHNSREQTRTTGSDGGMEGSVQETRTENEPGEDRSDVGWTPERGVEHQVGCYAKEISCLEDSWINNNHALGICLVVNDDTHAALTKPL